MPQSAERRHILNGRLVPESRLVVSPRDLGLLRGYGVFDFLISYQAGQPFHLTDHVERLFRSAALLELDVPWSKAQIIVWTWDALRANVSIGGEHQIRIVLSGGLGDDSMTPSRERATLVIFIDPHVSYPAAHYADGVGVVTRHHCRHLPAAKSINYIEGVRGVAQARRQGGVEVVYHDDRTDSFRLNSGGIPDFRGVFYHLPVTAASGPKT
ncbi:MAG: aminotransferase class IV [Pirellulales bacterium]